MAIIWKETTLKLPRKCSTIVTHALSLLETDYLEKYVPLKWQGGEPSSHQQADVAKPGSNQLLMLPSGRLRDQACPFATSIKSRKM